MVRCVACGLTREHRKNGVTFHRFPHDSHRRKHWLKFVDCEDEEITKHAVLCSQHFNDDEFDRSAIKVLLNNQAIPTKMVGLSFKYLRRRIVKAWKNNSIEQKTVEMHTESLTNKVDPLLVTTIKPEPEVTIIDDESGFFDSNIKVKQEEETETEVKKLEKQVHILSATLLEKDKLIENLRQTMLKQKTQILRLQSVVKDLKKRENVVVSQ